MSEIVYATQDVYVDASASNSNFEGNALALFGENLRLYSYIDFGSLSQFAGKEITEALIKIYISQNELSSDTSLIFYRITESWDASELTYNSQPDISDTNSKRKTLEDTDINWEQFNITELVQDIITQGGHGVRLEIEANKLVVLESIEYGGHKAKLEITVKEPDTPPVVNSIDWSPKGSFLRVAAGATYNGQYGTPFRVIGIVGTEQVSATIGSNSPITYNRGDSFVLDDEGYEILHAIDDGECTAAVIARDVSTNQHPTVGEEIQFVASVDWNDDGATATTRRAEWFYLKPPTETYTKAYADDLNNWTLFATGDMPQHTFVDVGDFDIIYIKVIARNMANLTDEFGVGTCVNGLFNLWKSVDGFEVTVVDGTGADDLCIGRAVLFPGTNAWIIDLKILRWDKVSNGVYFGSRNNLGCAYSDPSPDMCGSYPMVVGEKYAVYRSTSFITAVGGEDVYTLQNGRTPVTVNRSYLNFLEASVCGFFGLSGSECNAFVAELADPVFVANYASIMLTGKDTFGNERDLSWFDHIALPFALLGSTVPIPCAAVARKAGYAVAEISGKIFSPLVRNWTVSAVFDTPIDGINMYGVKIGFSKAIIDVGKETAEEIVRLLDLDDVDAAYTMLQEALNKFDPSDSTTWNSGFDWHEFNSMMKLKIDDPDIYLEYLRQAHILDGYGDYIKTVASKPNPTAAEKTAITHALNEPEVMKVIGDDIEGALKTLGDVPDQAAKAKRVEALENIAKNLPAAFDNPAKASMHDVNGYLLKHDVIENVLGKSTCTANYELVTRMFKELFDGVNEFELAASECNGLMNMAKEDPVAIAKAFEDYTLKTDKERLLASLGKSGIPGEEAAAWLAAAKKNFDLTDVEARFGTTPWDVVNDPSQIPMHGPHGVYMNEATEAMQAAYRMVPDFLTPELGYKFIQETAETVRLISTSDYLAELVAKAQAKDIRGIEDIFASVGVDIIRSKALADTMWNVSHRIDVMGDFINSDDLMTLTERMVEANVVEGSKLFEQMVDRIVRNGTITTDELKSFFDIVNHNPVEVALAMEKIPAGALSSFNNVLDSMGNKGKAILTLMDMRNVIKTKLGDVGDTLLNGWVRTTPLGLRLSRTQGSGFGSGVFKSNSVHSRLLEWAGNHWKALLLALGAAGAVEFAMYWFAFEWQPFHATLQRADVMDQSAEGKYTNAMYDIANDMRNLDWDVDKLSTRESVYNNVGVLCELVKYADENPIPNDKLDLMKETFELYMGTSEGLVGNALYIDIQKDLRQLLMKYTEQYVECVGSGGCAEGAECITGVMVYEQRESSDDKLSDADEYQTIIDDAWLCTITPSGGTIICSSNVSGALVWLDGVYKGNLFGETSLALQNVSIGEHIVKIEGGINYEPPYCEETIIIDAEGDVKYFDCQMTKPVDCDDVTNVRITIDPASPDVNEEITFSGSATSYDPIEESGYVWDFGDGTPEAVGKVVTHTYERVGKYLARLDVTNVCKKHGFDLESINATEPQDAGSIECTSNQMSFEVFLDGNSVGSSYGDKLKVISDVHIGTHSVKIQKGPGYYPESCTKTVIVTKDDTSEVYCEMDLIVADTATLTIQQVVGVDGEPLPGAWAVEIWVEGLYTQCKGAQTLVFGPRLKCDCEEPYNVPCALGVRLITLKKAGYDNLSKTFELAANDAKTWYSPTMVESTSTPIHTIEMNMPNDSIIYIDGEPAEETSVGRLISRIYAEGVPAKEPSVGELIAKLRRLGS